MRKQLIALGLILIACIVGYSVDSRGAMADELSKDQFSPFINTQGAVTVYGSNNSLRLYNDILTDEGSAVPLTVAENHLKTEHYFILPLYNTNESSATRGYRRLTTVKTLANRCTIEPGKIEYPEQCSGARSTERDTPFLPVFTASANDKYEEIINAPTNAKKRARLATQMGQFPLNNPLSSILVRGYLATIKDRPDTAVFVITDLTRYRSIYDNNNPFNGILSKDGEAYYFTPEEGISPKYKLTSSNPYYPYTQAMVFNRPLLDEHINKRVDILSGNLATFSDGPVWLTNAIDFPVVKSQDYNTARPFSTVYSEEYKIDLQNNKIDYKDYNTGLTATLTLNNLNELSFDGEDSRFPYARPKTLSPDAFEKTGCLEGRPTSIDSYLCSLTVKKFSWINEVILHKTEPLTRDITYPQSETQAGIKWSPEKCMRNYPLDDLVWNYKQPTAPDTSIADAFTIGSDVKSLVKFNVTSTGDVISLSDRRHQDLPQKYTDRTDSGFVDRYYIPIIQPTGDGWQYFPDYLCANINSFTRGQVIKLPSPEELARIDHTLDFSFRYGFGFRTSKIIADPKPDYTTRPGEEIRLYSPCETIEANFEKLIEIYQPKGKDSEGTINLKVTNHSSSQATFDLTILSQSRTYSYEQRAVVSPSIIITSFLEPDKTTDLRPIFKRGVFNYDEGYHAPAVDFFTYKYSGIIIEPKQSRELTLGTFTFSNLRGKDNSSLLNRAVDSINEEPSLTISNINLNKNCRILKRPLPWKAVASRPNPNPTAVPTATPTTSATPVSTPKATPTPTTPVISSVPTLPCTNLDFKVRTVYINKKGGYASNITLEIENKATVATTANLSTIGLAYDVNESQYATKYAITKLNSTTLPSPKVTEAVKYEPLVKADIKKQTHEFANVNIPANTKTAISLGNFTFNDRAPGLIGFYKNLKLDYLTARISNYSWNKDCVKDVPVVIIFGTDPNPVPTPVPTSTATPKPTATATPVPTATATATPKPSATPTPTIVSKPSPSNRPSPTATATTAPKPVPTNTTKPTPTATASTRPTNTNSPRPTVSATPKLSPAPTPKPSNKPSNGGVGSLIRDTVNNLLNAIFNRR